ncbi:pyridoxamine kinase [Patescibacteria group bacterium]|nr:pyridoxamine kinase [Patescibacteria group bacterium]
MEKRIKKVAAIHDLSGYGKASLTVVIPTLSAMGIQVCPLPTAILSAHTGFNGFTFLDLTDEMEKIVAHWKSLNLQFDAIYSGYLGSPEQVDIVSNLIQDFRKNNPLVVVDPVMGDDGKLYDGMNRGMVAKMRELIGMADLITPNLTEAAFLATGVYKEKPELQEIIDWMRILADGGPRFVIITSAPADDAGQGSVIIFDRKADLFFRFCHERLPGYYSGTGDTFASLITGYLLKEYALLPAVDMAMQFISLAIVKTREFGEKEICLEAALEKVNQITSSYAYEGL